VIRAWNRFFFAPADPLPLALFRIVFGFLVVVTLMALWPDLSVWYGPVGVLPRDSAWLAAYGDRLDVTRWLPDRVESVRWLFVVVGGAAAMLSAGLFTRLSAAIVFVGLASLHHRNPLILHSGDTLLRLCAFFLIFSHAGRALSLGRAFRRGLRPDVLLLPPWAQRLIQLQVSIVYVSTVCWKLSGHMWRDGTATWITSQLVDFQRFPVSLLFNHLWSVRLLTWGTLAIEGALGVLVWYPRLRYSVLATGILFHVGLDYAMDLPLFQWIVMSTLLCFLPPEDLRSAGRRCRQWVAGRRGSPAEPVGLTRGNVL
jgi:hypothetical protein